jgi:uracil-DNA glycosylase family 4
MPKYVPGTGNSKAKLVICGEAPGEIEDDRGLPFVGPSGDLLDEMLNVAGIKRSDVWLTNVVKYRPPQNDLTKLKLIGVDYDEQVEVLWKELSQIKPNCILALGGTALKALTGQEGITQRRGSIYRSKRLLSKVVGTYHPAHLLRQAGTEVANYSARVYVQHDISRAVEEAKFSDFKIPDRALKVIQNSSQLNQFIRKYEDCKYLSIDIETFKCVPSCIGLAFSKWEAVSVPLFNTMGNINFCNINYNEMAWMWKFIADLLASPKYYKVGQNFKFDDARLRTLGFVTSNFHADTMLMAHTLYPELPQSLAFLASIYTKEPYYKDEGRDFDPRKDKIDRLLIYNATDAAVAMEVFEEEDIELKDKGLDSFYYGFVHKLHEVYRRLEREGLLVDVEQVCELYDKYSKKKWVNQLELVEILKQNVNVNSPKQMGFLLYDTLKLPRRTETDPKTKRVKLKTDADTIIALLNNNAKTEEQKKVLNLIIKQRQVDKTLNTYIKAVPDYDGRMRTQYRITGTETGRTSTGILKAPIRPHKVGMAFQTLTKHGDIGMDVRKMFIPDPGCVFLELDLSQAEARVVAILADDPETLELFNTVDIHKLTASWIFGLPIDKITKVMRHVGKTVRHAGNYGMKKHRLMELITKNAYKYDLDITVSEWKAGKMLEAFHSNTPKIQQVFHEKTKEELAKNRELVNPFGRKRQFFARWDEDLFKEAYAYIPQSTVSDLLKKSLLSTLNEIPDLRICVEAHDAFMCMVNESEVNRVAEIIKKHMEVEIDFNLCSLGKGGKLIIPAEAQVGKNWKDLESFKF